MALCTLASAAVVGCQRQPEHPNIVLVVIDTARADHFSAYGYGKPTTPRIDAFGREAVQFLNAYSVSTWTVPAHASLFTGLFPFAHQATQEHWRLSDEFDTVAELLAASGYATAAFSNNPLVSHWTNLLQGFQTAEEMWKQHGHRERSELHHPTNDKVFEWLAHRRPTQPFFLFVNYIEPHFPYRSAPPAYREKFVPAGTERRDLGRAQIKWTKWYLKQPSFSAQTAALRTALYDAELAYADAIAGSLLDGLKRFGVYDGSLVIITSDHGENLGDHGHQDHVFSLYNSTVRIPLFVKPPGGKAATKREPVQLTDVFATIVDAASMSGSAGFPRDYNLLGDLIPEDRALLAEYYYPRQALSVFDSREQDSHLLDRFRRRMRSVQKNQMKLIWGSDGKHELYDLAADPGEERNLIKVAPELAAKLELYLERVTSGHTVEHTPAKKSAPLDDATRERLRALGYLR